MYLQTRDLRVFVDTPYPLPKIITRMPQPGDPWQEVTLWMSGLDDRVEYGVSIRTGAYGPQIHQLTCTLHPPLDWPPLPTPTRLLLLGAEVPQERVYTVVHWEMEATPIFMPFKPEPVGWERVYHLKAQDRFISDL